MPRMLVVVIVVTPERIFHVLQGTFEKLMVSWKKWGGRRVLLHARSDGEWRAWLYLPPASHHYTIPMANPGRLIRHFLPWKKNVLQFRRMVEENLHRCLLTTAHFHQPPRCVIIYIVCDLRRKCAILPVHDRKCPLTSRSVLRKDTILKGGSSSFKWPSELAGQGFILTWDGVPCNITLHINRLKFEKKKMWIESSRITNQTRDWCISSDTIFWLFFAVVIVFVNFLQPFHI